MELKVTTKEGAEVVVNYALGATIEENVELFGEEVCYDNLISSFVLRVRAKVGSMMAAGKSAEDIHATLETWKIGEAAKTRGATPVEKIRTLLDKVSPEDRAALLKELRATQKAAA